MAWIEPAILRWGSVLPFAMRNMSLTHEYCSPVRRGPLTIRRRCPIQDDLVKDLKEIDPAEDGQDPLVGLSSDPLVLSVGSAYAFLNLKQEPTHVLLGKLDAVSTGVFSKPSSMVSTWGFSALLMSDGALMAAVGATFSLGEGLVYWRWAGVCGFAVDRTGTEVAQGRVIYLGTGGHGSGGSRSLAR